MIMRNKNAFRKRFFTGIHTIINKLYIHLLILKSWDARYITQEVVTLYQIQEMTVKLHAEN